ncbi:MAG: 3-isopropylmalate dehydratase small subunit [Anaerolineae bacterium]|nr:3-isopropylmalate dehydratase small subunit [Anaerolineae bacterium]
MKLQGRVWKYGDDVDTDAIIPARYLNVSTPEALAAHCMEDIDPEFARRVRPGDILMAGENFGCGSSREHAPLALKGAGVSCIIACTFARIFFRNAINIGLPVLMCPAAVEGTEPGQTVEVDLERGIIRNLDTGDVFQAEPFPSFLMDIIQAGGLVEFVRRRLALERPEAG